ncbi:uncharacterized protein JCM10292_005238 [Rhodotorula paludigena]|uniref:uncharacterized protein n=1 Tax=Rhodotorula paludigena TaxID=86838 RepID=UPI0031789DAF
MSGYGRVKTQESSEQDLEAQNDQHLNELHSKIAALRGVTTDIYQDSRNQNSLLDTTSGAFDSFKTSLSNTSTRFARSVQSGKGGARIQLGIVLGFVFLFLLYKVGTRKSAPGEAALPSGGLNQLRTTLMAPKKAVEESGQSGFSSDKAADQSSSSSSGRVLAVTAAEHHTGSALLELILSEATYADAFSKVVGITFGEPVADAKAVLDEYNVETLKADGLDVDTLKKLGVDTICLIPPPIKEKTKAVKQVLDLAKQVKTVQNLVLLSSAGCDYADAKKQPHLREFIDLEILAMAPKSEPSTEDTGHSPCIVRAGFYLENLLAYTKQAQGEGKLPIPVDENHKFAPVALGDVVLLLAKILASKGPHGLGDDVRGQMITLTGPQMTAGPELAEAASQGLDAPLEFVSVQEAEAKKVLSAASGSVVDLDSSELALVLEYYALVRAGATNYVAGQPTFKMVTGQEMEVPSDWFKSYADSFKRKKRRTAKGE